jgi:hypothetical protein
VHCILNAKTVFFVFFWAGEGQLTPLLRLGRVGAPVRSLGAISHAPFCGAPRVKKGVTLSTKNAAFGKVTRAIRTKARLGIKPLYLVAPCYYTHIQEI